MIGLGLGLGSNLSGGSSLDSDVAAFKALSGATDVSTLNDLVKYLKNESLYDNFVVYPFKSAQNAGSGSTVYPLGGLTSNTMTLVNSPSWGASGVSFDGVNQYGEISDFLSDDTLTLFHRLTPDTASSGSADTSYWSQYSIGAAINQRSIELAYNTTSGSNIVVGRSSDGTVPGYEANGFNLSSLNGSERVIVVKSNNGGGIELWDDTTSKSAVATFGSPQTQHFNSSSDIGINCIFSEGSAARFAKSLNLASAVLTGTVTTTQRETITTYIASL